jgi:hypothetical protein
VGGVSILAKAKVFRAGVHFPAFSFEKHAETEGFGKVRISLSPPHIMNPNRGCENRWPNACSSPLSACRTTQSGISTSPAWKT